MVDHVNTLRWMANVQDDPARRATLNEAAAALAAAQAEVDGLNQCLAFLEDKVRAAQAQAAAQEQRIAALEGTVRALIKLAGDGGLTHDLIAQLYPDSKKPNGQPALDFAKHARRTINEARAALGEQQ